MIDDFLPADAAKSACFKFADTWKMIIVNQYAKSTNNRHIDVMPISQQPSFPEVHVYSLRCPQGGTSASSEIEVDNP